MGGGNGSGGATARGEKVFAETTDRSLADLVAENLTAVCGYWRDLTPGAAKSAVVSDDLVLEITRGYALGAAVLHFGRTMLLLGRLTLIFLQDPINDPEERIQLRPRRRPAPPVSWRHRERQHLRHRPRVDPEPPRRFPPAQPLYIHRSPHLPVQFHAFHPSALCPSWQKTFYCRTFAPALPAYPAAL